MQATKPMRPGRSGRHRIAAVKLSELAAEAEAGSDATTLERLSVKGLTRYYPHRLRGVRSARRGRAAADHHRLACRDRSYRRARVHDAGRRRAAWNPAPQRFLETTVGVPTPTDGPRHSACERTSGLIRHNTFVEPRNLDERGRERMSEQITKARAFEFFDRLNEKLKQTDLLGEASIVRGAMMGLAHDSTE